MDQKVSFLSKSVTVLSKSVTVLSKSVTVLSKSVTVLISICMFSCQSQPVLYFHAQIWAHKIPAGEFYCGTARNSQRYGKYLARTFEIFGANVRNIWRERSKYLARTFEIFGAKDVDPSKYLKMDGPEALVEMDGYEGVGKRRIEDRSWEITLVGDARNAREELIVCLHACLLVCLQMAMTKRVTQKIVDKYFVPNRNAYDMNDAKKLAAEAKASIKYEYHIAVYGRSWKEEHARKVMLDQLKEVDMWFWDQELRLTLRPSRSRIVDRF